jgi:hypothetical protein
MTHGQGSPEGSRPRREREPPRAKRKESGQQARRRRLLKRGAIGVIAAVGLGWLGYSFVAAKRLPPTGMADHSEESPPGHILTEPMPLAIQKHMLEHADGGGPPGVIINYNCMKFRCPDGMIERLATIARAYPAFVYFAPLPDMDVKIAVTRLGKILVLDEVDERRIREFIQG